MGGIQSTLVIIALSFVLCIPVEAQNSGKIVSNGTIAGVIVGVAAGVVVVAIVQCRPLLGSVRNKSKIANDCRLIP